MEKTIKVGNKSVRLSNNIGWTFNYRDQFNKDIVPVVMPMVAAIMDVVSGLIRETGKTKDIDITDILAVLDGETLTEALIHLSGLELVDFINIIWSMAKSVDEDIEEPRQWIKQFDSFPLDDIVAPTFELIVKGLVSSKNWRRLKENLRKLQPLISTQSSSQVLSEA